MKWNTHSDAVANTDTDTACTNADTDTACTTANTDAATYSDTNISTDDNAKNSNTDDNNSTNNADICCHGGSNFWVCGWNPKEATVRYFCVVRTLFVVKTLNIWDERGLFLFVAGGG